jgi:hypothetical protein
MLATPGSVRSGGEACHSLHTSAATTSAPKKGSLDTRYGDLGSFAANSRSFTNGGRLFSPSRAVKETV